MLQKIATLVHEIQPELAIIFSLVLVILFVSALADNKYSLKKVWEKM